MKQLLEIYLEIDSNLSIMNIDSLVQGWSIKVGWDDLSFRITKVCAEKEEAMEQNFFLDSSSAETYVLYFSKY